MNQGTEALVGPHAPIDDMPLRKILGALLLGDMVTTAGGTLSAIAVLRDALDYLEGRYARQVGREKQDRERGAAPAAPRKAAAAAGGGRRGRPSKKANGTAAAEQPPAAGLPFEPAGEAV